MILGAILAGGKSSRFGSDKAMALYDGRPLLDHVVDALSGAFGQVVICGREHAGLESVPDRPRPGLGPLGGINAALQFAAGTGYSGVVTVPCDTPCVTPTLLFAIVSGALPTYLSRLPVLGYWPTSLASGLDVHLHENSNRSVRCWLQTFQATALNREPPANINTPYDLEMLHAQS
jgi:molybdenum cofactor guanylyltransferase